MAHFAQIDGDNIVLQVIVVADEDAPDEAAGIAFCKSLLGADTEWVQTSYNNDIRHTYAGIGYTYDSENDVFLIPQPFGSWTLNTTTWEWEPPVPYPADSEEPHHWDEDSQTWQVSEVIE
jgi:hypothetical protein